jgi:predicted AlkP superfamily phosphohydrolase/phosphomutase
MTAEKSYENGQEAEYQSHLLKDLRASVRSIDNKVEEILDRLREHLEAREHDQNDWTADDAYDNDRCEEW